MPSLKSAAVRIIAVAVVVIIAVARIAVLVSPGALLFPALLAVVLAARAAIPVGLLDGGRLGWHVHRGRRCSRCADGSQADQACCGRKSDQGLAHGSVLPVVAVHRRWCRGASGWRRQRGGSLVANEVLVMRARDPSRCVTGRGLAVSRCCHRGLVPCRRTDCVPGALSIRKRKRAVWRCIVRGQPDRPPALLRHAPYDALWQCGNPNELPYGTVQHGAPRYRELPPRAALSRARARAIGAKHYWALCGSGGKGRPRSRLVVLCHQPVQQPNAERRGALRHAWCVLGTPCDTGNIEMHPRRLVDEALDELCGTD